MNAYQNDKQVSPYYFFIILFGAICGLFGGCYGAWPSAESAASIGDELHQQIQYIALYSLGLNGLCCSPTGFGCFVIPVLLRVKLAGWFDLIYLISLYFLVQLTSAVAFSVTLWGVGSQQTSIDEIALFWAVVAHITATLVVGGLMIAGYIYLNNRWIQPNRPIS